MASLGTLLHTWWNGELVGTDKFGNRYYAERKDPGAGYKKRRWVVYKGTVEASKVPADWHGWLHYSTDLIPGKETAAAAKAEDKAWLKEHLPNLTGTEGAYHPAGALASGAERAAGTGDYEAWRP